MNTLTFFRWLVFGTYICHYSYCCLLSLHFKVPGSEFLSKLRSLAHTFMFASQGRAGLSSLHSYAD
jgi:hypothetical protein